MRAAVCSARDANERARLTATLKDLLATCRARRLEEHVVIFMFKRALAQKPAYFSGAGPGEDKVETKLGQELARTVDGSLIRLLEAFFPSARFGVHSDLMDEPKLTANPAPTAASDRGALEWLFVAILFMLLLCFCAWIAGATYDHISAMFDTRKC